ncbi:PP2C family protein-serine/threonine phosphatase [Streptomyces sp. SLBN-31]|uniref:PP2C family protein-serine/threonine phosphatase n=1 Tax=Streptomyces sp. SLBN-31 TaxID=2768444 RepID=UPI001152DBAD|nr:PP2C family protein-serine/threonine phosphatase [Streptomyces sp. SLBN-31]TQJ92619.1 stage II sporulation protein E [Streptomyces sp. SLBN-31]
MPDSAAALLVRLMQASHTATLEQLPGMIADYAAAARLRNAAVFVVDLQETVLRQLTGRGPDAGAAGQEFSVRGSLPGQAYQRVDLLSEQAGTGDRPDLRRWWVAITDGVERLGVLRANSDTDDTATRQSLRDFASMTALLLLSKRTFSDSYARLVRTEPMNVAAEMQWNLTPPLAYAGHEAIVGAVMEPAYQVGGDAFDYAVADGTLHLGIFDAMGHDTAAGITASVAVAACRNARRQGASLPETSRYVENTLVQEFGTSRYVTAVLADLDMTTGRLTWINCGHPLPILLRDNRWTVDLACPPAGPMGARFGLPVQVCSEQLEPGDRLLLYTDGVVEGRDALGRQFGRDRFIDFVRRHHSGGQKLHETLRRLMTAVLDHHHGRLEDDATVLLTEWRGEDPKRLTP